MLFEPKKTIIASYEFIENAGKVFTPREIALLRVACTHESCWKTDSTIAISMGVSVSTVYRAIRSLVDKGVIMKTLTREGLKLKRTCHFNWLKIYNMISAVMKKSSTRCSLHFDRNRPVNLTDNKVNSDNIKKKKGFFIKDIGKKQRSITKILGYVAGNVKITCLTNAERLLLEKTGTKNELSCNPTKLMSLCGRHQMDYYKTLDLARRL